MNIEEASELIARHARNNERIVGVKLALSELKDDDRAVARLAVHVGSLDPTAIVEVPKQLAIVIYSDELARLKKDQASIEARMASVA